MSDIEGCWISRPAVWRPGQHPDARQLCNQVPARTVDLGDGYAIIACDRHLAAIRMAAADIEEARDTPTARKRARHLAETFTSPGQLIGGPDPAPPDPEGGGE